ncbi:hypothetical protein D3C75_1087560 [compost metagenome]
MRIGDAGKGQLNDHQGVASAHAVGRRVDDKEIAVGVFRQRVGGVARRIERHQVADQVLSQVTGGNEVHTVVTVPAGGG